MLLTDEQRKTFCEWLRLDIMSNKTLVEQLAKFGSHMEPLVMRKRVLIDSETIVLNELEIGGLQTIKGESS